MSHVEIEYCVPCGFLPRAVDVERALLEEFGRDLDGVTLVPGHGGVFEIRADDEVVWKKNVHGGDVDVELVAEAIRETPEH